MRPATLAGRFWRIVLADDLPRVLAGVKSAEGRFHHSGQSALYLSPSPEAAGHAVASYLKPGDPPRVVAPLRVINARVLDLRLESVQRPLGLTGAEAATPWQPQRARGLPATTWLASDAVRTAGADGMIYTARSDPTRWHLVLFRWNALCGAQVETDGPATAYIG
ncbi:MAG: RES family NAD+ phosphorylase [Gemmobacter sp.]|nr:RES family NAD+ phosphorylase [Gemmobacter sp.]